MTPLTRLLPLDATHLWAMVSTVLLAKPFADGLLESSWSVFWSTLAVASSMHKIWECWEG